MAINDKCSKNSRSDEDTRREGRISRRQFLKTAAVAAGGVAASSLTMREERLAMAQTQQGEAAGDVGIVIEGFRPNSIVEMPDGSLMTEGGQQSTDGGRTWQKSETFKPAGSLGLLRLPNGELGTYYADQWTMKTALGNDTNNWFFRWSADEGQSWSEPAKITLDGLTMGLGGTMFALEDGRVLLSTYSQFIGSRFDKRGGSWGTYQGVRSQTETEAHYPQAEAGRVYYSDDNGRHWQACDGWILGWRDNRWTDLFTEPTRGVELKDGRIMLLGRAVTGRVHAVFSIDRGHSWWPGAQPTELAASYSPGALARIPSTGDLLFIWNQLSRAETRKGMRRSRLSAAISPDEGETWGHFKNIEVIESLAHTAHIPPDPDMSPVWGDDEIGELPDEFVRYHYPNVSVIGDEVFVSYLWSRYELATDADGNKALKTPSGSRTRILPVEWFYT